METYGHIFSGEGADMKIFADPAKIVSVTRARARGRRALMDRANNKIDVNVKAHLKKTSKSSIESIR